MIVLRYPDRRLRKETFPSVRNRDRSESNTPMSALGKSAAGRWIFSLRSINHPKHRPCTRISNQIDNHSVPVVVEVTSLSGVGCTIRVEQADTFTTRMPDARIDKTFGPAPFELNSEGLRCSIVVGIKCGIACGKAPEIVKIGAYRKDDLTELRGPTWRFESASHEAGMMMDCLEQRSFE